MRTCLLCSAYFPPMGGIGVQRIAKLTRHLPAAGWRPVVVTTPAWSFRMRKDVSLLDEMPANLEIHRPLYFDSRKFLPGDLAKLLRPVEKRIFFPDKFRIWNASVLKWMGNYFRRHTADIVFINIPPFSGLDLATLIKKTFQIPVIVGLRDPFSFNFYFQQSRDAWAMARASDIERRAFAAADRIVLATPYMNRKYGELFPECAGRMQVITNGYDESDFEGIDFTFAEENPDFTVGYNGSSGRLTPITPLLDAIGSIFESQRIRIKLNIATDEPESSFRTKCPKLFKNGLVDFKGFLAHGESIRNLSRSHVFALQIAKDAAAEGIYSGKVFEYLRAGKPIILLHRQDSDIARLLAETRSGTTVDIDSREEIIGELLRLHGLWKAGRLTHAPDMEKIRAFDYRNLTGSLAELFNQTVGKRP